MGSHLHRFWQSVLVWALLLYAAVPARADIVTQWNEQTFTSGGPQLQRTLAMVHLGMFDAINAIEPRYRPYLRLPAPPGGANPEAAAASAAHGVLIRLFPEQASALDARLTASLAHIVNGPGKVKGVQVPAISSQRASSGLASTTTSSRQDRSTSRRMSRACTSSPRRVPHSP